MKKELFQQLLSAAMCITLFCSCAVHNSETGAYLSMTEILIEETETDLQDFEFVATEAEEIDFSHPQLINADSPALAYINNAEANPYKVSLEITADQKIEQILYAAESGYSNVISENNAVLGLVPEFYLNEELTVSDVVVKFTLDNSAIEGGLGIIEEGGIHRYQIFMWFEDTNMLLPIETFYDDATNTIYTHTDRLGTYCVMDLEKWLNALSAESEAYAPVNEPGNIIFCIDPRIAADDVLFDRVKSDMKVIIEDACYRYENMKFYIYYQQNKDGNIVHSLLDNPLTGSNYFVSEDYETIALAIDDFERSIITCDTQIYDFAESTKFVIENCDENLIIMYHELYDGNVLLDENDVEELSKLIEGVKHIQYNGEPMDRIYVNTICLSENEAIPEDSNFHKVAEMSDGMVYSAAE